MQQGRRHPHRHFDQSADRHPQIRRPLRPAGSRPLARGRQPGVRGGPQPAEGLAPEPLQRRHPRPRRPLENQGRADGGAGRFLVADPPQGRNTQKPLGIVPRGLDLGPVGLHRAGAVRMGRRRRDRLLRRDLRHADREGCRAFPRVDDRRGRAVPAQTRPLHRHGVHHPSHGHGPLHRRQPPAALQRPPEIQRRRAGAPVQRHGQTLDREDGRRLPRRIPDGERHHGQRMQIPAGARTGRRDAQRLRERLRMGRRGVLRQTRRSPPGDDLGGRGLPGRKIHGRPADRRDQRPLRIPQQGHRRLHRVAQAARRLGPSPARGAGLHHRAGRQPRPAPRFAGSSGRPVEAHRRRPVQTFDPLP